MIVNKDLIKKIIIGSAQFGMKYGISNAKGKLTESEIFQILDKAKTYGVANIDTAPTYGNAEDVLHNYPNLSSFNLITKLSPLNKNNKSIMEIEDLNNKLKISVQKLSQAKSIKVLIHRVEDILDDVNNSYIMNVLNLQRVSGIKIGVSIYDENQLNLILEKFTPDLVQLPMNIFDQRILKNGVLERMQKLGIEVHVRSCFLQGLVFLDPVTLPIYFNPIKDHLHKFHEYVKDLGISPLDLALSFIFSNENINNVVIGVTSVQELEEIVNFKFIDNFSYDEWAIDDEKFVNPALWTK
ncbi:MAG: aldo/keto reductase [Bacteriovorax sp.]|nr:aldo/keto reductase [Bacteriovorax sp.]